MTTGQLSGASIHSWPGSFSRQSISAHFHVLSLTITGSRITAQTRAISDLPHSGRQALQAATGRIIWPAPHHSIIYRRVIAGPVTPFRAGYASVGHHRDRPRRHRHLACSGRRAGHRDHRAPSAGASSLTPSGSSGWPAHYARPELFAATAFYHSGSRI